MRRLLSLWWLIMAPLLTGVAHADAVPEYEMKAAYLYNLATFTNWPAQSGSTVKLCLLGKDHFSGALERLTGYSASGVRITLSYLPNLQDARTCQILFIDGSEAANAADIVKQVEKLPVLTVTDNLDLFRAGVIVGLFLDNRRLSFDVNYQLALNASLNMSSKLLRVARNVNR